MKFDPDYAAAYFHRGRAWFGKKDYDKALANVSQSLRLDPSNTLAYVDRSRLWIDVKKEYDKGIADCDRAIKLDPQTRRRLQQSRRGLDP